MPQIVDPTNGCAVARPIDGAGPQVRKITADRGLVIRHKSQIAAQSQAQGVGGHVLLGIFVVFDTHAGTRHRSIGDIQSLCADAAALT